MSGQQNGANPLPPMSVCSLENHTAITFKTWLGVVACSKQTGPFSLNGFNLTISRLMAIALHDAPVAVPDDENSAIVKKMDASVKLLSQRLEDGWTIYGVNTGVGGSADARTNEYDNLQVALLQHLQSAIIPQCDLAPTGRACTVSNVLPSTWAKASILVRANQCLRGHSGIRIETVRSLTNLLTFRITPLIPKRGSISASGDLMPLSYIAGTITGNPSIFCQVELEGGDVSVLQADEALEKAGLEPVFLRQKEALALVNGTAPSAAAGAINIYHANQLALLAQLLTTFTAECLAGNVEWAAEFVHRVHPQLGQTECAKNMRAFLADSKLAKGLDPSDRARIRSGLCQDRYSTRTAPQWLGPYLEDLATASKQVKTELNSTSDNPLVQVDHPSDGLDGSGSLDGGDILQGGNFQATSITSAMDKTRQAIVMIGRLLFSQCTELINPMLNNNLPANLVADCPSKSFTMKGIDVNMTAYMSELASLASPVPVFPAEMNNQGVNSMALLSSRKTAEAIEILTMMIASHIFVLCQAADLRAFQEDIKSRFDLDQNDLSMWLGVDAEMAWKLKGTLEPLIKSKWQGYNTVAHDERVKDLEDAIGGSVMRFLCENSTSVENVDYRKVQKAVYKIAHGYRKLDTRIYQAWLAVEQSLKRLPTTTYLAGSSAHLYRFVREHLEVPFHRGAIYDPLDPTGIATCKVKKTIGTWVTCIYASLANGSLMNYIMPNAISPLPTVGAGLEDQAQLPQRASESKIRSKDEEVTSLLEKAIKKQIEKELGEKTNKA